MGYAHAGFEVVGVDKDPQPEYPFDFIQADAIEVLSDFERMPGWIQSFDAIHASFPCQRFTDQGNNHDAHPDLITPGRELLLATGLPFVMENVDSAPLRRDLLLCGRMFALPVIRHRVFELHGFDVPPPFHPKCRGAVSAGDAISVVGTGGGTQAHRGRRKRFDDMSVIRSRQLAMGLPWITDVQNLAEAIPPAYTAYVGAHLARALDKTEVVA